MSLCYEDNENIEWGPRGKDFWIDPQTDHGFDKSFGTIGGGGRRRFLRYFKLKYVDVPKCLACKHVFFNCVCGDKVYEAKIKLAREQFAKPFPGKLKHSQNLVETVLKDHKGKTITLSYSGGIDSECCVQLFKEAILDGHIRIVSSITGVNFPESLQRMKDLEKELRIKILRVHKEKGMSFKKVVEKYGLPLYSRGSSDREKALPTIKCCDLLKKIPMDRATKNTDVLILGLRGDENNYRRITVFYRGDYFKSKSAEKWRVYPIAYWSLDDVWDYQKHIGFNYNPIYNNTNVNKPGFYRLQSGKFYKIRTGCWSCPQTARYGYLEWLENYYPKFHKTLMDSFGLREKLTELGIS